MPTLWNTWRCIFPNFFTQQVETSIFWIWHLVHVISLATFSNIATRECKKCCRCFPWKVPSHNKCWKKISKCHQYCSRARNAITICYAWPADKFTFITPTKNRGKPGESPRNPFPTAIFHKLAKLVHPWSSEKSDFSIPFWSEHFVR